MGQVTTYIVRRLDKKPNMFQMLKKIKHRATGFKVNKYIKDQTGNWIEQGIVNKRCG